MTKILLGFMGAGKTTVGRLLDPNFHDMDELIVNQIGMSINDFFAQEGEEAFRKIETATLESLLANQAKIISPGGGIVVNPHNRDLLDKNPYNIYLRVDFDTLYQRIENDLAMQRPLYLNNTREEFKKIFEARLPLYEKIATHIIDVAGKTPEEILGFLAYCIGLAEKDETLSAAQVVNRFSWDALRAHRKNVVVEHFSHVL